MADVLTMDLLREVFTKSGESSDIESVLEIKGTPAVGNAENFCSNLFRTKVRVKFTSGKISQKSLILKIFLKNLEPHAFKEMKLFFANEVTMYDNILVHLSTLAQKYNMKVTRVWANCYFASTDVLIMDDLKEEGFIVPARHAGLNLQEAYLVMKYLAKLHALSIVADRRGLINPRLIRSPYTWVQIGSWTSKYCQKGIKMVGQLAKEWGNEWEDIGNRCIKYADQIPTILDNLFHEEVKLAVVNHGDSWVNNIMIKYKEDGITPESIKFVDFQNANYNSYAWDLVYFLYTSLQGDSLEKNYESLLSCYRQEFYHNLEELKEDTSLSPSLQDIKSEIKRLLPFSLTMSCTVMAIVFNTANQQIQIDDLTENEEKLRALYLNDIYKATIRKHMKYFIEQNVI